MDTEDLAEPPLRWKRATLLFLGTILFFWQMHNPVFLFSSPIVNDVLGFVLALGLPWLLAVAIFLIGQPWGKVLAIISALPLILYTFLVLAASVMTGLDYERGHDTGFELFAESIWKGTVVRFYRTNGGATTAFGVVIRHEKTVFPGLLLIRRVDTLYHCGSLVANTTESGIAVQDPDSNCEGLAEQRREYRLRRFIYF